MIIPVEISYRRYLPIIIREIFHFRPMDPKISSLKATFYAKLSILDTFGEKRKKKIIRKKFDHHKYVECYSNLYRFYDSRRNLIVIIISNLSGYS